MNDKTIALISFSILTICCTAMEFYIEGGAGLLWILVVLYFLNLI